MKMNAAQLVLLASEYTTFLHRIGFSTIEREFKFLKECNQTEALLWSQNLK